MLKDLIKSIAPLSLLEWMTGRTARVYALGPPKSGTTSLAGIFSDCCRAGHEPRRPATVSDMHAHFTGEISDQQLKDRYGARDKQLLLDLESNCFLAYRPDLLYSVFPDARFVVIVREPISWLDSIFDNNINFPKDKTKTMTKWHQVLFHSSQGREIREDKELLDRGLYPLDCYLEYWTRTYENCLRSLPESQRIVVGTNQIAKRLDEIGNFVGFDIANSQSNNSHKNRTVDQHQILQLLDTSYVDEKVNNTCQPLISEFHLNDLWV